MEITWYSGLFVLINLKIFFINHLILPFMLFFIDNDAMPDETMNLLMVFRLFESHKYN
jgi:hypothetical protein